MKKILSLTFALILAFGSCICAFAAESETPILCYASVDGKVNTEIKTFANATISDGKIVPPTNTEVSGYTFDGWFKDVECTKPLATSTTVEDGLTQIYAKYSKLYKLSFVSNVTVKTFVSLEYTAGSEIKYPDTKLDGYTFDGWFSDKEMTKKNELTKMPAADTTVYAKYTKIDKYTLSFVSNVTSKTFASAEYAKDETIKLPDTKLEGYTFDGWYSDKDMTKKSTLTKMPAENTTLYARYIVDTTKKYKLSFVTNVDTKKFDSVDYAENATITYPETKLDGYTFDGWFSDKEMTKKNELTKMPAADTTVYAKYTKVYKLTFMYDGKAIETQELKAGDAISLKYKTPDGMVLMGIYEDEKVEKLSTYKTMPTKDLTLYVSYAIKLSVFQEKLNSSFNSTLVKTATEMNVSTDKLDEFADLLGIKITYTVGTGTTATTTKISTFSKEVVDSCKKNITYDHAAWVTVTIKPGSAKEASTVKQLVFNDVKATTYKLSFVSNVESKKFDTVEYNEGAQITLPDTKLTGYTFDGWYTDKEMTKKATLTTMPGADTILYAKYSKEATTRTTEKNATEGNIPDTGSTMKVAVSAVAALTLALATIVVLKKKNDEIA